MASTLFEDRWMDRDGVREGEAERERESDKQNKNNTHKSHAVPASNSAQGSLSYSQETMHCPLFNV